MFCFMDLKNRVTNFPNSISFFTAQISLINAYKNGANQMMMYEIQTLRNFNGLNCICFLKKLLK